MTARKEFKVAVTKDNLVFASAHFITFPGHRCETLHGHNYRTRVVVEGGLDPEAHYVFDFSELKHLMKRLTDEMDHKVLLPLENPKIEVLWDTIVQEIHGDDQGLMHKLSVRNVHSEEASELPVTGIFIFIGFLPNTDLVEGHVDHDELGYLRTDANMHTSMPGLFAAGDVRAQLTRQVTTAVGDATTALVAAEKYLTARGLRTGTWSVADMASRIP